MDNKKDLEYLLNKYENKEKTRQDIERLEQDLVEQEKEKKKPMFSIKELQKLHKEKTEQSYDRER